MSKHKKVRLLLYDYLRSELGDEETRLVRQHLRSCASCSAGADEMRSILRVFPGEMTRPSDRRSESYWTEFAAAVERRVLHDPGPGTVRKLFDFPGGLFGFRRRYAYTLAAGGAALVLLLVVTTLKWDAIRSVPAGGNSVPAPAATGPGLAPAGSLTDFDRRLWTYFRRSRTLLVGVSNMDPAEAGVHNFEGEQRASRSLLQEARYLKSGPVDVRSSKLLDDLDRIMIELANADPPARRQGVQLVRTGIVNKNLLFKLRMQETRYARFSVQQASHRQERDTQ